MGKIPHTSIDLVKKLYYKDGFTLKQTAAKLGVGMNALVYFMRRHKLVRRTIAESNKITYGKKLPSFKKRAIVSQSQKDIEYIGVTLYWAEGYKTTKATGVDFANSDPVMVSVFLKYLRTVYELDEKKFRVLLYCYSDQKVDTLIHFWSKLTAIPKAQFTKPYVRGDFKKNGRKMQYGMVHVRYHDKKLLWDIMDMIGEYKEKYA